MLISFNPPAKRSEESSTQDSFEFSGRFKIPNAKGQLIQILSKIHSKDNYRNDYEVAFKGLTGGVFLWKQNDRNSRTIAFIRLSFNLMCV
jgi:hypothetical protein